MLASKVITRNIRRFPLNFGKETKLKIPKKILGIETSFDETAAAVLDGNRTILGEFTHSQKHNRLGGVSPWTARLLHQQNIERVIREAMSQSGLSFQDLDAIAVTTRPGMVNCLGIGAREALNICREHGKPLIKVHHMRAHALTGRLVDSELQYPFLCVLMSGGHCLLALVEDVEKYAILGHSIDDSPGELLDKVARRLRLRHYSKELKNLSGGAAIEKLYGGDPRAYDFAPKMVRKLRNCNFSFSGLKGNILRTIGELESEANVRGFGFIPRLDDFCASVQHAVFRQTAKRLQRAMEILDKKGIIPIDNGTANENVQTPRSLVLSGGVAANRYIAAGLRYVAEQYGYRVILPHPSLCTDNGVMIAWNGLEILQSHPKSQDIIAADKIPESLWVEGKSPIGDDWTEEISNMKWKIQKGFKINKYQYFVVVEPRKAAMKGANE